MSAATSSSTLSTKVLIVSNTLKVSTILHCTKSLHLNTLRLLSKATVTFITTTRTITTLNALDKNVNMYPLYKPNEHPLAINPQIFGLPHKLLVLLEMDTVEISPYEIPMHEIPHNESPSDEIIEPPPSRDQTLSRAWQWKGRIKGLAPSDVTPPPQYDNVWTHIMT